MKKLFTSIMLLYILHANDQTTNKTENNILISTKDHNSYKYTSPTEYNYIVIRDEKKYKLSEAYDWIHELPSYKNFGLIIQEMEPGGDNNPQYLGIVNNGLIEDKNSLLISSYWYSWGAEEGEIADYNYIDSEIYKDYKIKITNEKRKNGMKTVEIKNYRISDKGEFYEIK